MDAPLRTNPELAGPVADCLDAAIALTGAQKGNIQLYDEAAATLRIFVQRGFEKPFLEHFEVVSAESGSACGAALKAGERIVVEDLLTDPILGGTPAQRVLRQANVRAVQSTPLVSRSGRIVGMLSTHFIYPRRLSERELQVLDVLALQGAELIERFEAEKLLKESEERYRGLISAASEIVWRTDPQGQLQWISPKWFELTGQNEATASGWGWVDAIHPEDRDRIRRAWEHAVRTATRYEIDWRMLLRDGSSRDFETRAVPIQDDSGKIREWIGVVFDIGERKRHERALRESEQRFRAFVTSTSDVIYRMSADWKEMHHLDGRDLLARKKEPDGSWIGRYIDSEDRERVLGIIREAIRDKKAFELEHRVIRVDRTLGWMLSRAVPIFDEKGEVVEWFCAAADVTRQKELEEALRQRNAEV